MILKAESFSNIFERCVKDYHLYDDINTPCVPPIDSSSFDEMLYRKCWIDTVQWHLEDLIRDPTISGKEVLQLKRKIDFSNQDRTDLVEKIDDYFLDIFKNVKPNDTARLNTESLGWAVDRLSILKLKIFHMEVEVKRKDVGVEHQEKCSSKLGILLRQLEYLLKAIDTLLIDIESGVRIFTVYRQMKMYNDVTLNPVLYSSKEHLTRGRHT
jgi:hypothetical protein